MDPASVERSRQAWRDYCKDPNEALNEEALEMLELVEHKPCVSGVYILDELDMKQIRGTAAKLRKAVGVS